MKFPFNERKAAQAAAYLLKRQGGSMKYLSLIKLLYLADRECLIKTGRPITGDGYVSMDRGPVLSRVYDLLREEPETTSSPWFDYVSKPADYSVSLVNESPEADELSRFEIEILDNVFNTYRNVDRFELAKLTHIICPEWRDPEGSSVPIEPEDILRAASKSEKEIQEIAREAMDLQIIDNLLCPS